LQVIAEPAGSLTGRIRGTSDEQRVMRFAEQALYHALEQAEPAVLAQARRRC
jgi:hypothetical protein